MITPPIININDVMLEFQSHGGRFEAKMAAIGCRIGARNLGYRLTIVPPGKAAWPLHAHLMNEEMILILDGCGLLRIGDAKYPIRPGDIISLPPGGMESAHQVVNDSKAELKYLCVSTMEEPDTGLYPDSGKFGVLAGSAPGGDKEKRTFTHFGRMNAAVDYWDGEGWGSREASSRSHVLNAEIAGSPALEGAPTIQ